jgi:uncharacterized membrane protein YhaH (DUF805 family)
MDNVDVNQAVQYFKTVVTDHYTDFNGRVSRRDYWTYIAVYVVLAIGVAIVAGVLGLRFLLPLLQLALLMPSAGMTARRLQDTGKSGQLVWVLVVPVLISNVVSLLISLTLGGFGLVLIFFPLLGLIGLISLVAAIAMIYLCAQPGTEGPNEFGPPPQPAMAA